MTERLTRQELAWLLTQQAKSAAEKLRKGASLAPSPGAGAAPKAPGNLAPALDALDDAMSMLSSLYRGSAQRGRKGRIDLSALVWEVAPHARVSIEPGSGTEVYGDEAELRRMLQLLLGAGRTTGGAETEAPEVSIKREGPIVRVSVPLGPDPSASAETERAWLSRMATRYGGRLELEGGTQSILLPADANNEKLEIAALRRELEAAQKQGEAYARELAAVFAQMDTAPDSASPPPPSVGPQEIRPVRRSSDPAPAAPIQRRSPLELLALASNALAGQLRSLFAALARDAAAMRDLTGRELDGHPAAAPLQQLAQRVGGRLETASDLVGSLGRLGSVLPQERRQRHRIDLAEVVREECESLASRAVRRGIVLHRHIPETLEITTVPALARLLARLLVEAAIASTPPGGAVECVLSHEEGRARLTIEDGGPPIGPDLLERVTELEFDTTLVERPTELELLGAFAIAAELGSRLELVKGDSGGLVARTWFV